MNNNAIILREMRRKKNLTLKDVADKLSLDRTTVGKWELGITFPRADKAIELAEIYGCTMDELYEAWRASKRSAAI